MTRLKARLYDGMLMHALCSPDLAHDLGYVASIYTNKSEWKSKEATDKEAYNARDVDTTLQIFPQLRAILKQQELLDVYELVSVPMGKVSLLLRKLGVKTDSSRIGEVREKLLRVSASLEQGLPELLRSHDEPCNRRIPAPPGTLSKSGKPVRFLTVPSSERITPWRSDKSVGEWLYGTGDGSLGLPQQFHVKTKKPTTDKCVAPNTRILTSDLIWKKAWELQVGDELIAFDEFGEGYSGRKLRSSTVTHRSRLQERMLRLETSKGITYITEEHGFLRKRTTGGTSYEWTHASDLREEDEIAYFLNPWETDETYDGGYLAAVLDSEGSWSRWHISFAQNDGPLRNHMVSLFLNKGYTLSEPIRKTGKVLETQIIGEPFTGLHVVGSLRPFKMLQKARSYWEGRRVWSKNTECATVLNVGKLGEREAIGLQTTTSTLISDGFLSHNTALDKLYRLARNDSRVAASANSILAIKKLRQIDETLTTFAKEKMVYGSSIHTSFNVHGTSSGRLSSSDPNLQNIPEDTRCIYIPHYAGWKILQFDYSQIENRITAFLAHDSDRLKRLNDLEFSEHKWAASQFFGIPYDDVLKDNDKDQPYGKAKRIVHGSNYGMGARKIALLYDLQESEVKKLLATWKGAILRTSQWQEQVAGEAKREGFLVNAFGRKRWFYTSSYYTESLSFLPQSTAADILLRAMVSLMYERIFWPLDRVQRIAQIVRPLPRPANLLLTVHDSLVVEVPPEGKDEVVAIVKDVMQQPWPELGGFSCPVSVTSGPSWGEQEPYKE